MWGAAGARERGKDPLRPARARGPGGPEHTRPRRGGPSRRVSRASGWRRSYRGAILLPMHRPAYFATFLKPKGVRGRCALFIIAFSFTACATPPSPEMCCCPPELVVKPAESPVPVPPAMKVRRSPKDWHVPVAGGEAPSDLYPVSEELTRANIEHGVWGSLGYAVFVSLEDLEAARRVIGANPKAARFLATDEQIDEYMEGNSVTRADWVRLAKPKK